MKTTCPACGATNSLDAIMQHEAAREALVEAYTMSAPLGVAMLRYMGLFRPAARSLTWDRVVTLTRELLPMIQAGRIERNRRQYAVGHDTWCAAFEQMLASRDKLSLPLRSHGYLLEILAGLADKAEAAEQAKQEAIKRGETPIGGSAAHRPAFSPPPPAGGGREGVRPNPETVAAALASAKTILGGKREKTE